MSDPQRWVILPDYINPNFIMLLNAIRAIAAMTGNLVWRDISRAFRVSTGQLRGSTKKGFTFRDLLLHATDTLQTFWGETDTQKRFGYQMILEHRFFPIDQSDADVFEDFETYKNEQGSLSATLALRILHETDLLRHAGFMRLDAFEQKFGDYLLIEKVLDTSGMALLPYSSHEVDGAVEGAMAKAKKAEKLSLEQEETRRDRMNEERRKKRTEFFYPLSLERKAAYSKEFYELALEKLSHFDGVKGASVIVYLTGSILNDTYVEVLPGDDQFSVLTQILPVGHPLWAYVEEGGD